MALDIAIDFVMIALSQTQQTLFILIAMEIILNFKQGVELWDYLHILVAMPDTVIINTDDRKIYFMDCIAPDSIDLPEDLAIYFNENGEMELYTKTEYHKQVWEAEKQFLIKKGVMDEDGHYL